MNNTDPTSFKSLLAGAESLKDNQIPDKSGNDEKVPLPKSLSNNNVDTRPSAGKSQNSGNGSKQLLNALNYDACSRREKQEQGFRPANQVQGRSVGGPGKTVLVNTTQKENPLLNHLKNTNWRYTSSSGPNKLLFDYLIKQRTVLFLTLSYHKLYSEYISRRMAPLAKHDNNILLFVVDDSNSEDTLREVTKLCLFKGFTLLLAFSFEQAAKYIEFLNK